MLALKPLCNNGACDELHLRHWGGEIGRGRLRARIAQGERFRREPSRIGGILGLGRLGRKAEEEEEERQRDQRRQSTVFTNRRSGAGLGQTDGNGTIRSGRSTQVDQRTQKTLFQVPDFDQSFGLSFGGHLQ